MKNIFAAKIVYESFLKGKNKERRKMNLQREVDLLKMADKRYSITLIELFKQPDRVIMIQDFANGGSLNALLGLRQAQLAECEIQLIMQKLCKSLNATYQLGIIHRDLNINNVLLHVPAIERNEEDLQDPDLCENLVFLRNMLLKDLTKIEFEVKIADYGLSRILKAGQLADTACGTPDVIAPEALGKYFDQRVDVWGVGNICFSLITLQNMFADAKQHEAGKWCISAEADYSIECLRFINELVLYERERRPFPDKLLLHPYLKCNIKEATLVKDKLP